MSSTVKARALRGVGILTRMGGVERAEHEQRVPGAELQMPKGEAGEPAGVRCTAGATARLRRQGEGRTARIRREATSGEGRTALIWRQAGEGRGDGACGAVAVAAAAGVGRGGVGCGAVAAAGEGRARRRTERRRSGSREEKGLACQICRVRRLRTRVPDHVVLPILN